MLTVEDPIEYELPGIGQTQVNPKIDLTFAKALRAILRQDPDVIMIGEIRDFETAQIAIQASLTGHLVLATVHTNDAPSRGHAPDRHGRRALPAQSARCSACWRSAWCASCARICKRRDDRGRWHPVGCDDCGNTGYKGRTGVYELMVADDKVRALIHSRAAESQLFVAAEAAGLRSMREDGERLVDEGITRRRVCASPREGRCVALAPPPSEPTSATYADGLALSACPPTSSKPSTPHGKPSTGLLEADNAKAARAQLRAQALVPLDVAPVAQRGHDGRVSRFTRRVFSSTALAVWTRQLAGLVGSGLPLERALTALTDEAEDPRQRELVAHLRSEVNAGSPFARALASAPREFDDVYRAVVAAGEQSGALGTVLEKLGRRPGGAPGAAQPS